MYNCANKTPFANPVTFTDFYKILAEFMDHNYDFANLSSCYIYTVVHI